MSITKIESKLEEWCCKYMVRYELLTQTERDAILLVAVRG